MALFQNSVLKKYLSAQAQPPIMEVFVFRLVSNNFIQVFKNASVKLSLAEEAEWMAYFNEQKSKAQALQADITRLDRDIDALVYELYGLTEEEIRIVEGGEG